MVPILIDIPMPIKTPRLILRQPKDIDAEQLNEAILGSFEVLKKWLDWATHKPTLEESKILIRKMTANWILREDLPIFIFDKKSGVFVGGTTLTRMNWELPSFEIGYWIKSDCAGKGMITESTNALTKYAFTQLKAVRVEIQCDQENIASCRVAEKLGFVKEGVLKNSSLNTDKKLCDIVIYARYNADGLPGIEVSW